MARRSVHVGCTLAAAVTAALAVPGPVSAAPPVERTNERFSDVLSGPDVELCGVVATLTVTGHSSFAVKPVKGTDEAFLARDVFQVTEVWSTAAGSITIRHNGSFGEQTATRVPGTVTYDPDGPGPLAPRQSVELWRFTFKDAGIFRVYDATGRLLLKSTGVFKGAETFDTLGDAAPGAVPIPGTFQVLRDKSPFTDEQFCATVVAELT